MDKIAETILTQKAEIKIIVYRRRLTAAIGSVWTIPTAVFHDGAKTDIRLRIGDELVVKREAAATTERTPSICERSGFQAAKGTNDDTIRTTKGEFRSCQNHQKRWLARANLIYSSCNLEKILRSLVDPPTAKFHSVVLSSFTPPFCHGLVDIQVGSMVVFATGLSASVAGSRTKKHLGLIRCLIGFGLKVRRRTATMRMVRRQERAPERAGNSGLNVAPSDGPKTRQVTGRNCAK